MRIAKSDDNFDKIFGVRTSGVKRFQEGDVAFGTWTDATHYQASNPFVFNVMMKTLPINYEEFTFVDVGSGKGRTLLLASQYGFREVVGIEFDAELHQSAVENVNKGLGTKDVTSRVTCLHEDATEWRPTAQKLVLYFFNPFGRVSLTSVLKNVCEGVESRRIKEVYVLYLNPVHEEALRQNNLFQQVHRSNKLSFVIYAAALAKVGPEASCSSGVTRVSQADNRGGWLAQDSHAC